MNFHGAKWFSRSVGGAGEEVSEKTLEFRVLILQILSKDDSRDGKGEELHGIGHEILGRGEDAIADGEMERVEVGENEENKALFGRGGRFFGCVDGRIEDPGKFQSKTTMEPFLKAFDEKMGEVIARELPRQAAGFRGVGKVVLV